MSTHYETLSPTSPYREVFGVELPIDANERHMWPRKIGHFIRAVATAPTAQPIGALDLRGPLALVVGAEGEGVRPLVARTCDLHAVIPMIGTGVGSLNASVAAGVALYEVARQRAAKK